MDGITVDRVRRVADIARLPVRPVLDVARETVERTNDGWKKSPFKELPPVPIRRLVDAQIGKATAGTALRTSA